MVSTVYSNFQQPAIQAAWLNDVNTFVYGNGYIPTGNGASARPYNEKAGDTISVLDYFANGSSGARVDPTGAVLSTLGIQAAANYAASIGAVLLFPPGTYQGLLTVPSNLTIYGYGATLKLPAAQAALTPTVAFAPGVSGANIIGLTIDGNKAANSQTGPQDGGLHGVRIYGATNLSFYDITVQNCDADGAYIAGTDGGVGGGSPAMNLVFDNVVSTGNRRNGMSVIHVDGLSVINSRLGNSLGKPPQAGVDIEPNVSTQLVNNVSFTNCLISGNAGRGFILDGEGLASAIRLVNCNVLTNTAEDVVFTGTTGSTLSNVLVMGCQIEAELNFTANGGNTVTQSNVNVVNSSFSTMLLRDFTGKMPLLVSGNVITGTVDSARTIGVRLANNRLPTTAAFANKILVAATSDDIHLEGNYIEGSTSHSVVMTVTNGTIRNNTVLPTAGFDAIQILNLVGGSIVNNRINGGRDGILLSPASSGCLVDGNTITNTTRHGVNATGARHRLVNNRVSTCASNGFECVNTTNFNFVGNNVTACAIGARFPAGSNDGVIVANVLVGNTTNLTNGGTGNSVANNIAP